VAHIGTVKNVPKCHATSMGGCEKPAGYTAFVTSKKA